jgi:hypothetical protein
MPRSVINQDIRIGIALGAVFGAWALISTALDPLADDSVPAVALFYSPMFTIWAVAGFRAYRRDGGLTSALKSGTLVAFVTFVVFHVAQFIRINLFLDAITARSDWRYMVSSYDASGFASLRACANYFYLKEAPLKIFAFSMLGAAFGSIGGVAAHLRQPR